MVRKTMLKTEYYVDAYPSIHGVFSKEDDNLLLSVSDLHLAMVIKDRQEGEEVYYRTTGEWCKVARVEGDEYVLHRGGPSVKVKKYDMLSVLSKADLQHMVHTHRFKVAVDEEGMPVIDVNRKIIFI
jgi:hypothetical protein